MKDGYGRKIDYLRISVTDRCSERCIYCMPSCGITSVSHTDILSYDEIIRLVRIMTPLGFEKFKLTGGEPLVRRGLPYLIREMKAVSGVKSITLTTNGLSLEKDMDDLAEAGLDAVNISLDTASPELYRKITRTGCLKDVLAGIDAVLSYPKITCKLDCVLLGIPEQKLTDVAAFAKDRPIHVRFIELMPIGIGKEYLAHECAYTSPASGAGTHFEDPAYADKYAAPTLTTGDSEENIEIRGMSVEEAAEILKKNFGPLKKEDVHLGNGPAVYWSLPSFTGKIGFIGAVTHKFCENCNRVRLTSQGFLKTCLQYNEGADLKTLLRNGSSDEVISEAIQGAILEKPKEHGFFGEKTGPAETGNMNNIGG